jgi:hypothetical protein
MGVGFPTTGRGSYGIATDPQYTPGRAHVGYDPGNTMELDRLIAAKYNVSRAGLTAARDAEGPGETLRRVIDSEPPGFHRVKVPAKMTPLSFLGKIRPGAEIGSPGPGRGSRDTGRGVRDREGGRTRVLQIGSSCNEFATTPRGAGWLKPCDMIRKSKFTIDNAQEVFRDGIGERTQNECEVRPHG